MQPCIKRAINKHFASFGIKKEKEYIKHLFASNITYQRLIMMETSATNCILPQTFFNDSFDDGQKYNIFVYPLSEPITHHYHVHNDISIFGIPNYKSCIPFKLTTSLFWVGPSKLCNVVFNGITFKNYGISQEIAVYIGFHAKSVLFTDCCFDHCRIVSSHNECAITIKQCEFFNDSISIDVYSFTSLIIIDNTFEPRVRRPYEDFGGFRYGHIRLVDLDSGFVQIANNKFFCEPILPIIMKNNNGIYDGAEAEDRCGFRIAAQIEKCMINGNKWIFLQDYDEAQHDTCKCKTEKRCKKLRMTNMVYLHSLGI